MLRLLVKRHQALSRGVRMRVLVVDDEEFVRDYLREVMTLFCWEVNSAKDGLDALRMLQNDHYDVVVTDGEMNEMSGPDLTRAIKERYADIYVVGLSGSHLKEEFEAAGADAYIEKPIDLKELRMAIEGCLIKKPYPSV